jgi:hypothetical protein
MKRWTSETAAILLILAIFAVCVWLVGLWSGIIWWLFKGGFDIIGGLR